MKDTLEKVAEYTEYEKELIFVYAIAISSDLPNILCWYNLQVSFLRSS